MGTFYNLIVDNKGTIIGGAMAIGGNLLISVSMNLQKYALTRLQRQAEIARITQQDNEDTSNPSPSSTSRTERAKTFLKEHEYLRSKLWLFAIGLMIFGEVGNFMAYGFAPASVVAPLGTTTVVANTYIAIFFLGEAFRCQDALGTSVIVVGAFLIVLFATSEEYRLDAIDIYHHLLRWPFLIYVGVEVVLFVVVNILLFRRGMRNIVLFILPAALLASLTVIAAKGLSGMITLTIMGQSQLTYVIFYVMIIVIPITGVLQVRYVTQAMQFHNSSVVVPTFFVFFTLSAILAGIFFYDEFSGLSYLQIVIFLFGCGFSFLGVFFISSGRTSDDDPPVMSTEGVQTDDQPLCQFPYYHELVQPRGQEEMLLLDQEKTVPSYSRDTSAESLFNPDQEMASDIPLSPTHIKQRTSPLLCSDDAIDGSLRLTGDGRREYPKSLSDINTVGKTSSMLSWDPSADGSMNLQERTYRRIPPRTSRRNKDDSSSSNSS